MPLAFPAPAILLREWVNAEEEVYSPSPASPITPTLVIDPAILNEYGETRRVEQPSYSLESEQAHMNGDFDPPTELPDNYFLEHSNYSSDSLKPHHSDAYRHDGPQGPPPEPVFEPEEPPFEDPPPPPPPKRPKRVRRTRRELECGFCQGNDERNKFGESEPMLSCAKCGRSGHPTCVDIKTHSAEIARRYPWMCIECKPCEICKEKGDDTKLLFCDNCDRGWHYDCLDPPLGSTPDGDWNCPMCSPLEEGCTESSHFEQSPEVDVGQGLLEVGLVDEVVTVATPARSRGRPSHTRSKRIASSLQNVASTSVRRSRPKSNGSSSRGERLTLKLRLQAKEEQLSPFESFLKEAERDTSKTSITNEDKTRFEKSRVAAENRLAPPPPPLDIPSGTTHNPIRPLRSIASLVPPTPRPETQTNSPVPGPSTPLPSTPGGTSSDPPLLRIRVLRFGKYDIDTWYDAPFPEEYNNIPEGRLWMCEFCLKYMKSAFGFVRHLTKCRARHPPGDEIYRDGGVSVFEVDGRKNKIYCQNLCLLSKMFLDHKSLFYDVEPFLFYVMTEVDDGGARFVGYFSKEKRSPKDYNVSCIMTLPVRQRRGWGNLLIDFSFLLSKKEGRPGSPEKPLSALGALSYRSYWTLVVMRYLQSAPDHVTIESIGAATAMKPEDVLTTLQEQQMIRIEDRTATPTPKTPFPKHRRPRPITMTRRHASRKTAIKEEIAANTRIPTSYEIQWDKVAVNASIDKWNAKGYLTLKPENLKWTPYLLSRAAKFDASIQPLQATSDVSSIKPSSIATTPPPEDEPLSAVEQARDPNLTPEAGPSRVAPPKSPDFVALEIPDVDDDRDSQPAEIETPSRRLRMRSRPQAQTLRSLRSQHPSSPEEPVPERRRTRSQGMSKGEESRDDIVLNGVTGAPRSRDASIESVVKTESPLRKRRRVQSSPESSALSSPPTKLSSPPPSDGEAELTHQRGRPHTRSRRVNVGVLAVYQNGRPRNTNGSPVNEKRTSSRLNGASKIHSFTPLLDNPEAALRGLYKYRKRNSSLTIVPSKIALTLKQTNGVDNDRYEGSSVDEDSPVIALTSDIDMDDPDVDAEGEEEGVDAVRFDLGDEDAEGEDDIDAEGEPE